jgi:hypothetical protein
MPRAADASLLGGLQLPTDRSPLNRINYQPPKVTFDVEAFIEQWKIFFEQYAIPIIKDLTGIDLGFLAQLFDGIDLDTPGAILGAIAQALLGVVDAIISAITGTGATGNPLSAIMWALQIPMQLLNGFAAQLGQLGEELRGRIGELQAQLPQPDPSLANYTNIVGTLDDVVKDGVLQTTSLAAGYYNTAATSDKHGVNFTIDSKMIGTTRVAIVSDVAMASYVALEIHCGGWSSGGGDELRLVTGSSPTQRVIHTFKSYSNWQIQPLWNFEIKADPATRTVFVFKNNVEIEELRWVDADGILTFDASHRRICVVTNCDSNGVYGFYGPGVQANVRVLDW